MKSFTTFALGALAFAALVHAQSARGQTAPQAKRAPLAIPAPAGSGKTRVLTRRIAFRVREGTADSRHVLAVTFTRKAAGELVHRIAGLGIADDKGSGRVTAAPMPVMLIDDVLLARMTPARQL